MHFSKIAGYLPYNKTDKIFIYVHPSTNITYRFRDITNLMMLYHTKKQAQYYLDILKEEGVDKDLIITELITEVKQTNYEFSSN